MVEKRQFRSIDENYHKEIIKKIKDWCSNGMLKEAFDRAFIEKIHSDGYIDISEYVSDQNMDLVRQKIHYARYIELPKIDIKTCEGESLKCEPCNCDPGKCESCICASCKYKPYNSNMCKRLHFYTELSELYKEYVIDVKSDNNQQSMPDILSRIEELFTQYIEIEIHPSTTLAEMIVDIITSHISSDDPQTFFTYFINSLMPNEDQFVIYDISYNEKESNKNKKDTFIIHNKGNVKVEIVKCLSDFITHISRIYCENHNNNPETTLFYRGQAKVNYTLKPQVLRTDSCRKNENVIYQDMMISCPDDLVPLHSHLDRLAMMQHYQVPTRLLDVTRNPLVALFMATRSHNEYAGEVFVFAPEAKYVKYHDSDTVSVLSSLALLNEKDKEELLEIVVKTMYECCDGCDNEEGDCILRCTMTDNQCKLDEFNSNRIVHRLVHEVSFEKPGFLPEILPCHLLKTYFVHALKDNPRIIRQDGLFMLTGLNLKRDMIIKILKKYIKDVDEKYINKNNDKIMKIMNKVVTFNDFRYPWKTGESDKITHVLIIPHTCKEKIQQELDQISINQQTMMPELSDVAQEIARKYR